MIIIEAPSKFEHEIRYVFDILLTELLGIEFNIQFQENIDYYCINLVNGSYIKIFDDFFSKYKDETDYLRESETPKSPVKFGENKFTVEANIPIIFGSDLLVVEEKSILLYNDIVSSSFFMLSRWEEFVNKKRNEHGQFNSHDSYASKNKILERPIVNEFSEMIWNMLSHLGYDKEKKRKEYTVNITHDIDNLVRWNSAKDVFTRIGGDLIRRKSFYSLKETLKSYIKTNIDFANDPWNCYDYLMNISEKNGLLSHFFFMSGGKTSYDNRFSIYSSRAKKVITNIIERGHAIGFHPSFNSHLDEKIWADELSALECVAGIKINTGRQHYLRFEAPHTWQIWENNNMAWDSTMGYYGENGFRCGICSPFSVFNILTRRKLLLVEKPLIIMDVTLFEIITNNSYDTNYIYHTIQKFRDIVKKYNGEFTILWHNSSLFYGNFKKYGEIYEDIIKSAI
jgi:hypothetical protein